MASVTFPTALGGDGKTYSDDADPDTGLDGLGYVDRFVPCLKNTVAMAGYTAQYAAKIDAAAANADRAEVAKLFVEAVSSAYRINILEQHKQYASLGLDFIQGKYWVDQGERIETLNPSEILTIARDAPVLAEGPNGQLYETASNQVARVWHQGEPKGALIQRSSANRYPFCTLENHSVGGGGTSQVIDSKVYSGNAISLGNAIDNERAYLLMAESFPAGITQIAVSFYVEEPIVGNVVPTLVWASRVNEPSTSTGGNYDPNRGFPQLVTASFTAVEGFNFVRVGLGTTTSLIGRVVLSLPQLEYSAVKASSRILTTDMPVTRPSDSIFRPITDEINTNRFSVLGSFNVEKVTSPNWFDLFKIRGVVNTFGDGLGGQYRDNGFRVLVGNSAPGKSKYYLEISYNFKDMVGEIVFFIIAFDLAKEEVRITINEKTVVYNVSGVDTQMNLSILDISEGALGIGGGIAQESLVKTLREIYLTPYMA